MKAIQFITADIISHTRAYAITAEAAAIYNNSITLKVATRLTYQKVMPFSHGYATDDTFSFMVSIP